jgi:uncharacterized membrane protein YraQ (UPF0718 family)
VKANLLNSYKAELIGFAMLLTFTFLYFYGSSMGSSWSISKSWLTVNTLFLSVLIEAVPFVLIGAVVSSIIQVFIPAELIRRWIPGTTWLTLVPAVLLASLFPICECAIVLVVRRLVRKGMPLHIGAVFLVASPLMNPIVTLSTYYAFQNRIEMIFARWGLGFIAALVIGIIVFLYFRNRPQQLLESMETEHHQHDSHGDHHTKRSISSISNEVLTHTADEFYDMGKFLIIGALLTAIIQTFLDRSLLLSISNNQAGSTIVMMGMAYILSLCSEADAFVAASLGSHLDIGALLAFMLLGPILDLKSTIMLFAWFRKSFVMIYIAAAMIIVFAESMLYRSLF